MIIAAVDPGEVHVGIAELELPPDGQRQWGWIDGFTDGRLGLVRCFEASPADAADYIESRAWLYDRLVIERFRLYPWMARQQGFSEFGTCETIGVLKRIARKTDLPVILQDASGNKRDGRTIAQKQGFRMTDRKMGSGRFVYWGPDFDIPGESHKRDAAAHAVVYGWSQLCSAT